MTTPTPQETREALAVVVADSDKLVSIMRLSDYITASEARIKELEARQEAHQNDMAVYGREIVALRPSRALLIKAKEVLVPFAVEGKRLPADIPDALDIHELGDHETSIRVGHLRKAAALVAKIATHTGDKT